MAIRAENLTVSYGRTTILHSLSFGPLEPGKVVGLIGPNAAGKSTLVKTIAGIKEPSEGSVMLSVDGAELGGGDHAGRRDPGGSPVPVGSGDAKSLTGGPCSWSGLSKNSLIAPV